MKVTIPVEFSELIDLIDEFTNSLDAWTEDVGGLPRPDTYLSKFGPAVDRAKAKRKEIESKDWPDAR